MQDATGPDGARGSGTARRRRGPRKATPKSLENAALFHLQRFAASSEQLRRVLLRRVERSARFHGTDRDEGARAVDSLIARFRRSGLLDDAAYAEGHAATLHRRGVGGRGIRARLRQKGVAEELIEDALATLRAEHGDAELAAAAALVRRRRLGPCRRTPARDDQHRRDLAALARAGFGLDVARRVLAAETPEDLEALLEEAAEG
jgi:regulatory protein